MIDKLLATEKSLILRALADGHPLSELRPFGGYEKFDRDLMAQLRAVHNKHAGIAKGFPHPAATSVGRAAAGLPWHRGLFGRRW